MSTYSIAGVSRLKGELKVRFANDMTRVKVLQKNGHSDIDLIELKEPMTKEDAIAFLISIDFATKDGVTNEEVNAALHAEVEKRGDKPAREPKAPKAKAEKPAKAPKAEKPAKAPRAKKSEPSLDAIAARAPARKSAPKSTVSKKEILEQISELEDAPF